MAEARGNVGDRLNALADAGWIVKLRSRPLNSQIDAETLEDERPAGQWSVWICWPNPRHGEDRRIHVQTYSLQATLEDAVAWAEAQTGAWALLPEPLTEEERRARLEAEFAAPTPEPEPAPEPAPMEEE